MTFFLNDQPGAVEMKARGTDTPLPGFWGGVSAAFQKEQLESNANWRRQSMMQEERKNLASKAIDESQGEVIRSYYGQRGLEIGEISEDQRRIFMTTPDAVRFAQKYAEDNGLSASISEDDLNKRVNDMLAKEHDDIMQTLNATSGGASSAVANIAGSISGAVADIRNLPFAFGGGGGSLARVMGREALLNAAAESVTLPDRFAMAKRLNIPEPDVAQVLAIAAAGGALFGGAIEGASRGLTYWRGTRGADRIKSDVPAFEREMNIDVAEDALATSRRPFQQAKEGIVETRRSVDAPDRVGAVDPLPEPVRVDGGEVAIPARVADDAPETLAEAMQVRDPEQSAAPVAEAPAEAEPVEDLSYLTNAREKQLHQEAGGSKPLISHLQKQYGGIKPGSRLAVELQARGVTSKTAPGLFRQNGRDGFDNIPASDEPTIAAMWGDDGNGYLDEAGIADAIVEEIAGRPQHVNSAQESARAELANIRAERDRLDREQFHSAAMALDDELFRMPPPADWVDVPSQREAINQQKSADLRDVAAKEEVGAIDMGDGRGPRSLASILDELDADDEFAAMAALCGRRPAA